jgi:two-component system cell cycle sensor histidine kinase/response regulator CckA
MYVDDERSLVELGKATLESFGYHVQTFTDNRKALADFQANPKKFDLVITDMTIPYMTGAELVQNLLNIKAEIPTILCSDYSELINEEKAKDMGIRRYLMKPMENRELGKVVREVLVKG